MLMSSLFNGANFASKTPIPLGKMDSPFPTQNLRVLALPTVLEHDLRWVSDVQNPAFFHELLIGIKQLLVLTRRY